MQIRFQGDTDNSVYKENNWYVEGVGDKIKLVKDQDLIIPAVSINEICLSFPILTNFT